MAKNEQRLFPTGLCETCFWRFECGYAVDNPNEHVRTCDGDGGLSYMDNPGRKGRQTGWMKKNQKKSKKMRFSFGN